MCGILGGISKYPFDSEEVKGALDSISHRGPDNQQANYWEREGQFIMLGHTRLSIIDLSDAGNQPMIFEELGLAIVFNGEVYNHKELKQELEKEGVNFITTSDTEVVLKAYHFWGLEFVERLIGMFAIAIYDLKVGKLILIRDRAGVKPLYYSLHNNHLLFGSELKSLVQFKRFEHQDRFSVNSSAEFLKKGWIPAPNTIYKDAYKLIPGTYLEYTISSGDINHVEYWSSDRCFKQPKLDLDYAEIKSETEKLLKSASEYRMVADTQVGIFLSGGYDSSLVTALLQTDRTEKLSTFSIGFDVEEFNEAPYARQVADHLGTNHHELIIGEKDALATLNKLAVTFDEPFGDSSAIPTMLVSQMASQHVKVALSADGGDEVFGGYTRYHVPFDDIRRAMTLRKLGGKFYAPALKKLKPPKNIKEEIRLEKLISILRMPNIKSAYKVRIEPKHFSDREISDLYKGAVAQVLSAYSNTDDLADLNKLDFIRAIEYKTTMVDDILVKVDRSSMAYSLESREPLLDHRLVEWVGQLEENSLHGGVYPKRLIRDICHQYIPESIMNRPKKGFAIPTEKWMKGVLKDKLEYYCSPEFIKAQGLFNEQSVSRFLSNYLNGFDENHERPWIFMMHQMWWEEWMA